MKKILKNISKSWKTTLLGVVTIGLKILAIKGKLSIEDASTIAIGAGLILSKDADKTHSNNE